MLEFTSALYLGLRHPTRSLPPWSKFTTGVPAALASPPGAVRVARRLARLQTCEHGVLGASTFHLFWDLFGMFARRSVKIYVDAGLYPIARWAWSGRRHVASRRASSPITTPRHSATGLNGSGQTRLRPVLVTDGFCPDCGKPAPLSDYLETLRSAGGRLIVDDTQALGLFGYSASSDAPYGRGGGGTLPRLEIGGPDVLVISSLAKAFGAPVAVLSGGRSAVQGFEANSETRIHAALPHCRSFEQPSGRSASIANTEIVWVCAWLVW